VYDERENEAQQECGDAKRVHGANIAG